MKAAQQKLRIYLEHYEKFILFFYSSMKFLTVNLIGDQVWLYIQKVVNICMEGVPSLFCG